MTRLDYDAVGKVLKVVAAWGIPEPERSETVVWRRALSDDVSFLYTFFRSYSDLTSASRAKRRVSALVAVAGLADKIRGLIDNPELPLLDGISRHMPQSVSLAGALEDIGKIADAALMEQSRLVDLGFDKVAPLSPSADDPDPLATKGGVFIADMAKAFKAAYGVPARITYDDQEPSGPFLAFVSAVMQEAAKVDGAPLPVSDTPEAIAQAFIRAGLTSSDKDA